MSILRIASRNASYALFLKLVSGAMRAIAMSASAMMGSALVGFCVDKTVLLVRERSPYSIFGPRFLACQMPDCQAARFFSVSTSSMRLTKFGSGIPNAKNVAPEEEAYV